MRRTRPTLARFEAHSLALFTTLALGCSGVAAQALPAGPPNEGAAIHAQALGPVARPAAQVAQRPASADEAFGRADTDRDGKLSREEAQRLPAVWERFDQIDTNRDRYISNDEFHRGIAN